jgi:hypothetical protein
MKLPLRAMLRGCGDIVSRSFSSMIPLQNMRHELAIVDSSKSAIARQVSCFPSASMYH